MTNQDDVANRPFHGQSVSRRSFLKNAMATAVAASATGAGAAIYNQSLSAAYTVTSVANAPVSTAVSPTSSTTPLDTTTRLVAAQAENVRLQAALETAQNQLANLQQNNQAATDSESQAIELGQANAHVNALMGLIALYEQLEEGDVGTAVQNGLNTFSGNIDTMLADLPTLSESIQIGRQALQNFESQVPVLDNGRLWLIDHLNKIGGYFQIVEQLLTQAVDRVGPLLQMLTDWFESIKKWLPFGLGQAATTIMQSITNLVMETPNTINGLESNISQPLNVWLNRDQNNETALHRTLIKPLRDDLMSKADTAVAKAQQIDEAYKTVLQGPMETAVASQRAIRNLIAEYRQQHGV